MVTQPGVIAQLPALAIDVKTSSFASTALALLCGLMTGVLAFGVAFLTIFQHLVHYNSPKLQKFIVRILMVVPIYSVLSLLSLIAPPLFLYFEVFRDIWEAAMIYFFSQLILVYCGGESSCAHMIQQHPGTIKHTFPINLCWKNDIPLDPLFVKKCKRATLQFVIVKPLMGMASIVIFACGGYFSPWWRAFEGVVYNTCYSIALYALVLFYVATRYHPGLKGSNPVRKFVAVKIIVFATFWQSFFLQFVPGLTDQEFRAWVNFILLCEMPLFSLLQAWAFPVSEFIHARVPDNVVVDTVETAVDQKELQSVGSHSTVSWANMEITGSDTITPPDRSPGLSQGVVSHGAAPVSVNTDVYVDTELPSCSKGQETSDSSYVRAAAVGIGTSIAKVPRKLIPRQLKNQIASVADPDQRRKALDNVMEAVNMNDIVTDAYYNFNRKYQGHAMMETEENPEPIDDGEEELSPQSLHGGDFDPQALPDSLDEIEGGEGVDEGSTKLKKAGASRSYKKAENYYFNTHLPGFTDHPITVSKPPAAADSPDNGVSPQSQKTAPTEIANPGPARTQMGLNHVIGRPEPQEVRNGLADKRMKVTPDHEEETSRVETSDGEGSSGSLDQFTWQKAPITSQDGLGTANV